jgi:hypothetical protein
MIDDQEAVDALIASLDSLAGLLYTVATDDRPGPGPLQRGAARTLAERVEERLAELGPQPIQPPDSRRSRRALRDGFVLVGGVARDLAEGILDERTAARALLEVVEQIGLSIDMRWLSAMASAGSRSLLPATVRLVGELSQREAASAWPTAGGEPAVRRRPGTVLTMLLRDNAPAEARRALDGLHAAGVPYSVLEVARDGHPYETLWLPGMRAPLRRRVAGSAEGAPAPVLTWGQHAALAAVADERIGYAELVTAYLSSTLGDARGEPDLEALSRVAEALDDAA